MLCSLDVPLLGCIDLTPTITIINTISAVRSYTTSSIVRSSIPRMVYYGSLRGCFESMHHAPSLMVQVLSLFPRGPKVTRKFLKTRIFGILGLNYLSRAVSIRRILGSFRRNTEDHFDISYWGSATSSS